MRRSPAGKPSIFWGQNLYLRLLIVLLALVGTLEASLRQVGAQIALFLLFLLAEPDLLPKLARGLRLSLPFFAAYWLFATLLGKPFPEMLVFTLKLVFFIIVSVYSFGSLNLDLVLRDTRALRRTGWGNRLVRFALATALYLRAYAGYFSNNKPQGGTSIASLLDSVFAGGAKVYARSEALAGQLDRALSGPVTLAAKPAADCLALVLLTLSILIQAI